MKCLALSAVVVLLLVFSVPADQPSPKPVATGLENPQSVVIGPGGKTYVSVAGVMGKDGDGAIVVVEKGTATIFASGLDDPKGIVMQQGGGKIPGGGGGAGGGLLVVDKNRIWRIDPKGKAEVFMAADAFPTPPISLCDITVDPEGGSIYVSDAGDKDNKGSGVFKIAAGKKQVTSVADQKRWPELKRPASLILDGQNHLLLMDAGTGTLHRIHLAGGAHEVVAEGLGEGNGLAWDLNGRLFISDAKSKKVYAIGRPGHKPVALAQAFEAPGDICKDGTGRGILVVDSKAGTLTTIPAQVPGAEVDESPMDIKAVPAFTNLKWTDWSNISDVGKPVEHRPILLTHAGDGSNRIFVPTQQGVLHVFPNDPKADKTKVFLDLQKKVVYNGAANEEGFLGLAFHPLYKKTGEFFIFYSLRKTGKTPFTNIVSRFRVSKDDRDKADPTFEEELMRFEHKNFNHDGGTICFGPDGYLYITTGDGGAANDPDKNGQNLNTLLAKVLRIDVDKKDPGLNYAVPKDNPFVGRKDARPEVWAYGLRNLWRMAFDKKTGALWAGEVGQNLYEEVNIIVKGGNYGWSIRESLHPFSAKGVGPRPDLVEPIWEFNHSLGMNCIIGGHVYRGKRLPELDGHYLYADYPTGKVWALRYDDKAQRVTANRPLQSQGKLILSFGEDEMGEAYYMLPTNNGKGIYQFERAAGK